MITSSAYRKAVKTAAQAEYEAFAPYRVSLRAGRSGRWRVAKFRVALDDRYLQHSRGRPTGIGRFTGLIHDSKRDVVMSDTLSEIRDVQPYLPLLRGDVLITGLGLGMVPGILLNEEGIRSITVIEKDADVIRLVAHQYPDQRLRVVNDDAFRWKPDKSFDCAWHDIWDRIRQTNRAEYARIRAHYSRRIDPARQFCWGESSMLEDPACRIRRQE